MKTFMIIGLVMATAAFGVEQAPVECKKVETVVVVGVKKGCVNPCAGKGKIRVAGFKGESGKTARGGYVPLGGSKLMMRDGKYVSIEKDQERRTEELKRLAEVEEDRKAKEER